jgi:putrescine transport system ATP-binding protein
VRIKGTVDDFGYLGNLSLYRVRLESGKIILVSQQNRRRSAKLFVEWEEKIWITWRPRSSIVLVDQD